jgi:hypothetical protein
MGIDSFLRMFSVIQTRGGYFLGAAIGEFELAAAWLQTLTSSIC